MKSAAPFQSTNSLINLRIVRGTLSRVLLVSIAGVAWAGCGTTRVGTVVRSTEPPPSYKTWDKLTWIENQLQTATDSDRPELLVRMAELYVGAERPDRAGSSARQAIYSVPTGTDRSNSITSRARAVLGAIAITKEDRLAARRELEIANKLATNDTEKSVANALLAIVEERDMNPSMAVLYRQKVTKPGDARVLELTEAIEEQRAAAAVAVASKPATNIAKTTASNFSKNEGITIIDRERWRPAKPGPELDPMGTPTRITVHHEGKEFNGTTIEESLKQIRNIQDYHQRERKWADIGYHFVIDRIGNIIEGRDLKYQGAHAGEKNKKGESPNAGNIGISILGNYDTQTPNPSQIKAINELIVYLKKKYKIGNNEIYTHNEIKQKFKIPGTGCPGKNLNALMEQLRKKGLAALGG